MKKLYIRIFPFLVIVVVCLSTQESAAAIRSCKALLAEIRNGLTKKEQLLPVSLTASARTPWFYQRESLNPLFGHVDQMGPNEIELVYIRKHGLAVLVHGE